LPELFRIIAIFVRQGRETIGIEMNQGVADDESAAVGWVVQR